MIEAGTQTPLGPSKATTGRQIVAWIGGAILFLLLATANGAGYRYGVSDQAFYIPVVEHAINPETFPRDAALIDAQGRLMITDEIIAGIARLTSVPLDAIFLAGYLLSVALIGIALVLIGQRISATPWVVVAILAALTLRHRIPRTSANSFEPYFHPRMLAFAVGLLAVAAMLRRRTWLSIALVAAAGLIHVTTGLWFSILIGVALVRLEPALRRLAFAGTIVVVAAGAWALSAGPLRASVTRMDAVWLQAVASKDSLFASQWPLWAWVANLALLALLWWAHRRRQRAGQATAEDEALIWGATALVAFFLLTLPLVVARLAFPVQLQISRVFWLVDVLATIYVLSSLVDRRTAKAIAIGLVIVSVSRGVYVMVVERPDRALFSMHLSDSPWEDAMRWLSRQPIATHVLADPGHSWKFGTSVRVSAARDVFLEDVKDSAIAIYSRDVAHRVVERAAALGDFTTMTPERAQTLAAKYDLNYLVTEQRLDLPTAYENTQFRIYSLRTRTIEPLNLGTPEPSEPGPIHSYRSASMAPILVARRAGT